MMRHSITGTLRAAGLHERSLSRFSIGARASTRHSRSNSSQSLEDVWQRRNNCKEDSDSRYVGKRNGKPRQSGFRPEYQDSRGKSNSGQRAGIGAAGSEPRSRFVCAIFVSELAGEHLLFLPCTINLQWNEHHERPEKSRNTGEKKHSSERQSPKDVNGVPNPRIQAIRDEYLRFGTHRK